MTLGLAVRVVQFVSAGLIGDAGGTNSFLLFGYVQRGATSVGDYSKIADMWGVRPAYAVIACHHGNGWVEVLF